MIIKKVKDYMTAPIYVIERNEPIQRARNLMFKYGIGTLPVLDGGRLVGIVTNTTSPTVSIRQRRSGAEGPSTRFPSKW